MGENNVAFTEDEQHNNELNIIKDKEQKLSTEFKHKEFI